MKKYTVIYLLCLLVIFQSCEKNECSNVDFEFIVDGKITKAAFELCTEKGSMNLIAGDTDESKSFFEYVETNKEKLVFTSKNDETRTRIDVDKSLLFKPNQIAACDNNSELNIIVDFYTRISATDISKKQKINSISGQKNKFTIQVTSPIVIDSINITAVSLSRPCVLKFSQNEGAQKKRFFVPILGCGNIVHEDFQLHWSNIQRLFGSTSIIGENTFVGEIAILFEEDL